MCTVVPGLNGKRSIYKGGFKGGCFEGKGAYKHWTGMRYDGCFGSRIDLAGSGGTLYDETGDAIPQGALRKAAGMLESAISGGSPAHEAMGLLDTFVVQALDDRAAPFLEAARVSGDAAKYAAKQCALADIAVAAAVVRRENFLAAAIAMAARVADRAQYDMRLFAAYVELEVLNVIRLKEAAEAKAKKEAEEAKKHEKAELEAMRVEEKYERERLRKVERERVITARVEKRKRKMAKEQKKKDKLRRRAWQEVWDDGGNLYYFNSYTEESSWERPEEMPLNPREKALARRWWQMANMALPPIHAASANAQWIAAAMGTEWIADSATENAISGPHEDADSDSVVFADPGLPDGWTETNDELGAVYYYNEWTGDTAWERPGVEVAGASGAVDAANPEAVVDATSAETGGEAGTTQEPEAPVLIEVKGKTDTISGGNAVEESLVEEQSMPFPLKEEPTKVDEATDEPTKADDATDEPTKADEATDEPTKADEATDEPTKADEVQEVPGVNYTALVTAIYQQHNPEKLDQDGDFVSNTLNRYAGREAQLMTALNKKYG
jgi:hypothetical protein